MEQHYRTDQTGTRLTRGAEGHAVHLAAIRIHALTGARARNLPARPLCGTTRTADTVATSLPVTCKRCLRHVEAAPCTATFSRWHNRFGCELGGEHYTHRALAGTVIWRDDETVEACDGRSHTVLWRDPDIGVTVTRRDVPAGEGESLRPVYSWFAHGALITRGLDRDSVEADITAHRCKALEAPARGARGCVAPAAELHVCYPRETAATD